MPIPAPWSQMWFHALKETTNNVETSSRSSFSFLLLLLWWHLETYRYCTSWKTSCLNNVWTKKKFSKKYLLRWRTDCSFSITKKSNKGKQISLWRKHGFHLKIKNKTPIPHQFDIKHISMVLTLKLSYKMPSFSCRSRNCLLLSGRASQEGEA